MKGKAALLLLVLIASCTAGAKLQESPAKELLGELKSESHPSTTRKIPEVTTRISTTTKHSTSSRSTDSELSSILSIRQKDMLMESTRSGDDEDSNNEKV